MDQETAFQYKRKTEELELRIRKALDILRAKQLDATHGELVRRVLAVLA